MIPLPGPDIHPPAVSTLEFLTDPLLLLVVQIEFKSKLLLINKNVSEVIVASLHCMMGTKRYSSSLRNSG